MVTYGKINSRLILCDHVAMDYGKGNISVARRNILSTTTIHKQQLWLTTIHAIVHVCPFTYCLHNYNTGRLFPFLPLSFIKLFVELRSIRVQRSISRLKKGNNNNRMGLEKTCLREMEPWTWEAFAKANSEMWCIKLKCISLARKGFN